MQSSSPDSDGKLHPTCARTTNSAIACEPFSVTLEAWTHGVRRPFRCPAVRRSTSARCSVPGLLLLPGLAAAQAGPASILAWAGLLGLSALLAIVFTRSGTRLSSAAGVAGYTAAGLGRRAGSAVGWCFLAGVVAGAPVVCLVGASYVTTLTGGGRLTRAGIAAGLLVLVLLLALGGVRVGVVGPARAGRRAWSRDRAGGRWLGRARPRRELDAVRAARLGVRSGRRRPR